MSDLSEMASEGRQQVARGGEFEASVGKKLTELFDRVETHKRIEGSSGVRWRVDFVVDSNLVLEASVQRRLETKINSTFLRFVDVTRKFPNFKACLVLKELYVGFHKSRGKKFFPTSEYRTMLMHGFPIVSIDELFKLTSFAKGEATALEVSSRPAEFNQRTMFSPKHLIGPRIIEVLANGPLSRQEIARKIGKNRSLVDDAVKLLPQVKKEFVLRSGRR